MKSNLFRFIPFLLCMQCALVFGAPDIQIQHWRDQSSWEKVPVGSEVDLGRVFPIGCEKVVYFHIRNSGDSLLSVSGVSIIETEGVDYGSGTSSDGFSIKEFDPYAFTFIKPGEGVYLAIKFTASRFGIFQSALQIESNLDSDDVVGMKVNLKIQVESEDIWDHVPAVFPKADLEYLGDKRFTSERFGSFEIDTTIKNRINHAVLGPGIWWKEDAGTEVILDTELWGKFWTSFNGGNPDFNGPDFRFWSYYYQSMFVVDLSGVRVDPFRYSLEFNPEYPQGWFSYIGLTLFDTEGFYERVLESYDDIVQLCGILKSPAHDISGKTPDRFQILEQLNEQFLYFSQRCEESIAYLKLETNDSVQITAAEELKETTQVLRIQASDSIDGVYDPPDQVFELSDNVRLEVLHIPNGSGLIGSPDGEAGRDTDEEQRKAWQMDAFAIGKTEVTQRQWIAIMGTNPSFQVEGDNLDHPVNNVSYFDAMEFCRLLSKKLTEEHAISEGTLFRLPMENEWEMAARFGNGAAWGTGNVASSEFFNIGAPYLYDPYHPGSNTVPNHLDAPAPVMSFPNDRSLCGAYDFLGNVSEWCVNDYAPDYSISVVPDSGYPAVVKGGSWKKDPFSARFAHREPKTRTDRAEDLGFRVVLIPGH